MKPSSQTHYRTLTEIEKKGLLNSTEWHGFGEPTQRLSSLEFSKGIGKGSCQFTNARNEAITEWIRMWPSLNCSLISNLISSRYSAQCCVTNTRRDNSVNKIRIWWNGKVGFYRRDVSIHFFFALYCSIFHVTEISAGVHYTDMIWKLLAVIRMHLQSIYGPLIGSEVVPYNTQRWVRYWKEFVTCLHFRHLWRSAAENCTWLDDWKFFQLLQLRFKSNHIPFNL